MGTAMLRLLVGIALASTTLGLLARAPVPKDAERRSWKYPAQVGTEWIYDYRGTHDAQLTCTIIEGEERDGVQTSRVRATREWLADGMKVSSVNASNYTIREGHLFEMLGKAPEFCLLKGSFRVGDVWQQKHTDLAFNRTVVRVVTVETINVPAGAFECVQLETKAYDGDTLEWKEVNWYASDVGLVKSVGGPLEKEQVLRRFTSGKVVR